VPSLVRTKTSSLAALGLITYVATAMMVVMLSSATVDARSRETSKINYHPNIVGTQLSTELKALADAGNRAWIIMITDINRVRGTSFRSFETWLAASPDDPIAPTIEEALKLQNQWTGNRSGDGP